MSRHRIRRRRGWPIVVANCVVALMVGFALLKRTIDRRLATELPEVPPVFALNTFGDQTPVAVTITADWQKVSVAKAAAGTTNGRERAAGHQGDHHSTRE